MAQNGRTSFTGPDSEGARPSGSNGAGMFFDAARRRDRLVRRESHRRSTTPQELVREAYGYKADDVERAAQLLCDHMKSGRVSESMVEYEQREDANRLTAWQAVGLPDAGSPDREKIARIQYRMAVRNRALELHMAYDMEPNPDAKATPTQPAWKPWRAGAAPGNTVY